VTLLWFASRSEKSPSLSCLVVVSYLDISQCTGTVVMLPLRDS
jgi:hypothetical protein